LDERGNVTVVPGVVTEILKPAARRSALVTGRLLYRFRGGGGGGGFFCKVFRKSIVEAVVPSRGRAYRFLNRLLGL